MAADHLTLPSKCGDAIQNIALQLDQDLVFNLTGNFPLTIKNLSSISSSHRDGSYPSSKDSSKVFTIKHVINRSSIMASGFPAQFADPVENGMNALRSKIILTLSSRSCFNHLSGQNLSGFGKK